MTVHGGSTVHDFVLCFMLKSESEETKCADIEKNDLKNQTKICLELLSVNRNTNLKSTEYRITEDFLGF